MKNKFTFLSVPFKLIVAILIFTCQVTTTNAQGNALNFDPANDYVTIGPSGGFYTVGQAYTKEAWILSDLSHTARNIISSYDPFFIEHTNKVNASNDYVITPGGELEHFDVYDPIDIPDSRWTFYAVTFDGVSTLKMYRNGILVATGSCAPYTSTATQTYIGAFFDQDAGHVDYFYKGNIDQVRIYDVALTQAQIQSDMVSTTSAVPANLKAYYDFNSGNAGGPNPGVTSLIDVSGNGNTGILNNFALDGNSSNWVGSYAMIIPVANTATGTTNTTFNANWATPVFGSGFIDRYIVDVATDPDFTLPVTGSPFTVAFGTNTLAVTGLTANTTYYYRVSADKTGFDNQGAFSNTISVTTLNILPVNSLSFNVSKTPGGNLLQWSTESEQNSHNFELQRSTSGNNFNTIAVVNAAGNSTTTKNYQYSDPVSLNPAPIYYYRLKLVDINGSFTYSNTLLVKNTKGVTITVYPNPAQDKVTINVTDKNLLNTNAVLSDISGKLLQNVLITQTVTTISIGSYERGVYMLRLSNGESIKLVKD